MESKTTQTQDGILNGADLETSAGDLVLIIENGEGADALKARIETLNQRNFVHVLRVVQRLDTALLSYAAPWQNAENWGHGQPFPDEQAQAKGARA